MWPYKGRNGSPNSKLFKKGHAPALVLQWFCTKPAPAGNVWCKAECFMLDLRHTYAQIACTRRYFFLKYYLKESNPFEVHFDCIQTAFELRPPIEKKFLLDFWIKSSLLLQVVNKFCPRINFSVDHLANPNPNLKLKPSRVSEDDDYARNVLILPHDPHERMLLSIRIRNVLYPTNVG